MKTINPNDRGVLVQYLQLALTRAGYPTAIDGSFGPSTCGMLNRFLQRDTGCTVTQEVWELLIPYLKGYTKHTVTAGDSFHRLAQKYGTTVERIRIANLDIDITNIPVGAILNIPFNYPVVSTEVPYTSLLNEYVIEGLAARYPFLGTGRVGKSVMGKPLLLLKIGRGKKQIFYNASFHANENITTPILLKFAEDYAQAFVGRESLYGADAQELFYNYQLNLVPMVNPDGVDLVNGYLAEGSYYNRAEEIAQNYPQIPFPSGWKANIDGTDLNLQFPANWLLARETKFAQGYTLPAPRDYVGEAPLSAPESRAIYDFTRENNFLLILAYHTQGEVIYWKYLDYEPDRSWQIAEYFSKVSGYAAEETPTVSGYAGYKDWFIMEYNRPGYTIEAGLGTNPLPISQFDRIYEDNRGILVGGMTQI